MRTQPLSEGTLAACPPHLNRKWLRTAEAAEYLGFITGAPHAAATLETWRVRPPKDGGPAFHRVGRCIVYYRSELDRYGEHRLGAPLNSTSEAQL